MGFRFFFFTLMLIGCSNANAVIPSYNYTPVIKGERLLIVSQPPRQEPRSSFITIPQMDGYYGRLLNALKRRDPQADALSFVNKGQQFWLMTNAPMSAKQLEKHNNPEMYDSAVMAAVNKVCPTMNIKALEGEGDYDYFYIPLLTRILNKQAVSPFGSDPLLMWKDNSGNLNIHQNEKSPFFKRYPTKNMKLYQQVQAEYVSRWNETMFKECKRIGNAPDISKIPPVRVTHKIVGRSVFVIDEPPFVEARISGISDLQNAIYVIRLAQAMKQRNPVVDAKSALMGKQFYLLGYKAVAMPRGRAPVVSYGFEYDGMSVEEAEKLTKVCPVRVLEGSGLMHSGSWGKVDLSAHPNPKKVRNHEELSRRLYDTMVRYKKQWNQIMLPKCKELLNRSAGGGNK